MSTLHTVNKSPFTSQTLLSSLNHTKDGDAVLLIEDAVYGATAGTQLNETIKEFGEGAAGVKLYVLEADLQARGIDPSRLMKNVSPVDYAGFVKLACHRARHNPCLALKPLLNLTKHPKGNPYAISDKRPHH